MDPISIVLAFFVSHIMDGILGNEAHQVMHSSIRRVGRAIDGDAGERSNHDIARTVRLAHLAALEQVLDAYAIKNADRWKGSGGKPAAFLESAASFCRDRRHLARTDPASLAGEVTATLEATIDSLLARQQPGSLARERDQAMGTFAEEAVLEELRTQLPSVAVPKDFEEFVRPVKIDAAHPFLTGFTDEISLAFKADARFRNIVLVSGIAEVKAQGFEITEILLRVEKQFGVSQVEILASISRIDIKIDRLRDGVQRTDRRTESMDQKIDRLLALAESGGANQRAAEQGISEAAVRKVVERLGGEGIGLDDLIPWLDNWVEAATRELCRQSNESEAFEAAWREAEKRFKAGRISEASEAFIEELKREDKREAERQHEHKQRQIRLLEGAIRFDALAFNAPAIIPKLRRMASIEGVPGGDALGEWLMGKATEFFWQGDLKGSNPDLVAAISTYRAALEERTRDRVPLDWATTQNNLGAALATLGARESGTARLEEAVAAQLAALKERTRDRVPLDWAATQMNLGAALATLGEREGGTARLEEAVAAQRAALEELTRDRAPRDWAATQINLGNALRSLGAREGGTARLEEAVAAYRASLEELTLDRVPLGWAMAQNNLGAALATLGERESGTARLEEAVVAYRASLEELTLDRMPLDWATTQNNLGEVLATLGERQSGTARLEEAVAAREACLTVTASVWPTEWVEKVRIALDEARAEITRRSTK